MTSVLVVDDQALIRAGLVALLTAAPGLTVVGEAANGEQAVALAAALRPGVVLMDIRMPGMDGITATRRILASAPEPPPQVVMLTTFDLDEYVYQALRAGAAGFVLKETEPARLLRAIYTVAEGEMMFAPTVIRRMVETYVQQATDLAEPVGPAGAGWSLDALTTREQEVLRLVGTGITNADIAARLSISEGTVKTHLNRIMTKLDLTSRAQAVVVAYETGLVVPGRGTGPS